MAISSNIIAPHVRDNVEPDPIFTFSGKAQEAKAKFGGQNVLDATIGVLLDDDGELVLLPAVEAASRMLDPKKTSPYAPIAGLPEFRHDVIQYLYQGVDQLPPLQAVATAGATGAIRLSAWDFLGEDDPIITHDAYWSPYRSIAADTHRRFEPFPTFTPEGKFNIAGALARVDSCLKTRDRALLLINTPCHNPTGMSLTCSELETLYHGLIGIAEARPSKSIVFLVDGAYWEFGDPATNQALLSQFRVLPENMLFCVAFTMSKSLTRYGFRTGALIYAAHDQKTSNEVAQILTSSIRATWSNTNRMGQVLFSTVFRDAELRAQLKVDQEEMARLCNRRGEQFIVEAKSAGLTHTPYTGGFFLTLPCKNPMETAERMAEHNLFLAPLDTGVRVALCALPGDRVAGLAARLAPFF